MLLMYFVELLMKLVVSCELPVVYIQEGPSLLPTLPQSWKNNIVKIMFIYLCISCKCMCVDTQLVGISSLLHHVDLWDPAQGLSLGNKRRHLPTHLTGPRAHPQAGEGRWESSFLGNLGDLKGETSSSEISKSNKTWTNNSDNINILILKAIKMRGRDRRIKSSKPAPCGHTPLVLNILGGRALSVLWPAWFI